MPIGEGEAAADCAVDFGPAPSLSLRLCGWRLHRVSLPSHDGRNAAPRLLLVCRVAPAAAASFRGREGKVRGTPRRRVDCGSLSFLAGAASFVSLRVQFQCV
ncbi:uncharacterized protein Tco025E_08921 [Trypanosoma conorhini]|uniref:Uncharacterized protein n=1 Tax=Trypanosoma conorhini TaxID=83891 RepID=A0A422N3M1_9TRYP|nr:uncharacterized protein Tco025E_08921 [Trypanosoma conorhini]RNF00032.1 hypothetical protein Tco025E_08921 [Trypanosoma conorhini]